MLRSLVTSVPVHTTLTTRPSWSCTRLLFQMIRIRSPVAVITSASRVFTTFAPEGSLNISRTIALRSGGMIGLSQKGRPTSASAAKPVFRVVVSLTRSTVP